MRDISTAGIEFIKAHEQLRLAAYDDFRPMRKLEPGDEVLGTVTIGWGHIKTAKPGMVITEREAEELLRADLKKFIEGVDRNTDHLELKQHEFDALVSFAFNVGLGALRKSTLLRLLYEGAPREDVAEQFHRWVFSKGVRLEGLAKRRKDEANLFLHGAYSPSV